ncbi:MAG TPA: tetratricopeptide repeat protein, partial [Candidatus Dormibacteraeota bacterium]|nr:tetratricopeptide repeat protein [Candidatus Dormibacteraeota bacterium]
WKELGNEWAVSTALNTLGGVANFSADLPRARQVFEEMLALRRRLGDEAGVGVALANLALVEADAGNLELSETMVRESAMIQVRLGDRQRWAVVSHNLALNLMLQGRLDEAQKALQSALVTARELGDRHEEAFALADLAAIDRAAGHPERAVRDAAEALGIAERVGVRGVVALGLEELGLSLAPNDPLETAWFWGAAQAVRQATGYRRGKAEGDRTLAELEQARAGIDRRAWEAAEAAGRAAPETAIRDRAAAVRARADVAATTGEDGELARVSHG